MRLDPGRRAAVAVGVAVLLAAIVTGVWVMSARPRAMAVAASSPTVPDASPLVGSAASVAAPSPPSGIPASSSSMPAALVVDVAGKVHRPGLYHLRAGARVDDALRAAGGPLHGVDLSSLNLAARVIDGQQIAVGIPAAGAPAPASGSTGAPGAGGAEVLDLNTASLEQLEALPGVGPVLGQHILDWRAAHGQFASVDQLQDVSGIGPAKFAAIRALVSV